jgi:hypothetical protein
MDKFYTLFKSLPSSFVYDPSWEGHNLFVALLGQQFESVLIPVYSKFHYGVLQDGVVEVFDFPELHFLSTEKRTALIHFGVFDNHHSELGHSILIAICPNKQVQFVFDPIATWSFNFIFPLLISGYSVHYIRSPTFDYTLQHKFAAITGNPNVCGVICMLVAAAYLCLPHLGINSIVIQLQKLSSHSATQLFGKFANWYNNQFMLANDLDPIPLLHVI